jgi:hypothetical protein
MQTNRRIEAQILYRRWIEEVWQQGTISAELIHHEFVGHWPEADARGLVGLEAVVTATHHMFDELVFKLELGPFVDGDYVFGRWTGVGVGETTTQFIGNDVIRISDSKIIEFWPSTTTTSQTANVSPEDR